MASPLALFPLRTVLFPHMPLALHIFEERYQRMMADCLEEGVSFGVVSIREGVEAGGDAVPAQIGTLARIVQLERLDGGRMNLFVTGASRFRVLREVGGKPYRRAEVEYLAEPDDALPEPMRRRLTVAFNRYVERLQEVSEGETERPELPPEPEILSYLVAAALDAGLGTRQALLEAPSVNERVALELATLRLEADLLRRQVVPASTGPDRFSQN